MDAVIPIGFMERGTMLRLSRKKRILIFNVLLARLSGYVTRMEGGSELTLLFQHTTIHADGPWRVVRVYGIDQSTMRGAR